MNRHFTALSLILALAATPVMAFEQTLYCGSNLIALGTKASRVRDLCGAPDQVTTSYVERSATIGVERRGATASVGERELIPVERWYYESRSNTLSRDLEFREGTLRAIKVGS